MLKMGELTMFFNELSLSPPVSNLEDARRCRDEFINLLLNAKQEGLTILRVHEDFREDFLCPWYTSNKNKKDENDLRELKRYLTSLATKSPYFDNDSDIARWKDMDCFHDSLTNGKNKSLGLTAAYNKDGLAVSICSSADWEKEFVTCEIEEILGEDVSSQDHIIRHVSSRLHLDSHAGWLGTNKSSLLKSGSDLWAHVTNFFPQLQFCSEVEGQMQRLSGSSLRQIQKGLEFLNDYGARWQDGSFNSGQVGCNISTESQATLKKYSSERTFQCPDGSSLCFNWHAKLGDWRIHFHFSSPGQEILIGYVGKHLPTVKYPK